MDFVFCELLLLLSSFLLFYCNVLVDRFFGFLHVHFESGSNDGVHYFYHLFKNCWAQHESNENQKHIARNISIEPTTMGVGAKITTLHSFQNGIGLV